METEHGLSCYIHILPHCGSLNKSVPSGTQSCMVCKLLCSSEPPEGLWKPRLCLTLPGDLISMVKVERAFRKTPDNSLFTFFKMYFFLFAYLSSRACVCGHVWITACVGRSEDYLQKAVSAFHHADPAAQTQIVRLGSTCFYWLSCLIDPGSQLMKHLLIYW